MAAKLLTTEEKNYLKSVHLTFIIGTDAVKTYFDCLHPPANLVTHLAKDKSTLELLEEDRIISRAVWEKLYPRPGARPTCTSAEFDITTLICLLREMTPKVPAPRHTSFDQLPDRADKSTGACLAIIKWYRNFLAHPDQVKLKTLSSKTFNDLFTRVEMAIQVLGKNQFSSEITAAKNLNIDNDIAEILEKILNYEKQFQELHEGVNRNSSQTRYQQKEIKELQEKFEEIEIDQKEEKRSQQQVEGQMSEIINNLKLQKEALEKKVKEQKQLAATQTKHSKQIQKLEQETGSIKKTQDDQRKEMKELTDKHHTFTSQTEGLANTAKQVDELKDVHGKEIKDLQVNQQNPAVRNIIDQTIAMIQTENLDEVYVKTRAVYKCLEDLRHCPLLVLASISGRGKSALGLCLAEHFLQDDHENYQPLLFSGNEIENKRDLIDFKKKYFIIVEDLFGRFKVRFDDEKHKFILDILNNNLRGEECNCKLILTVRKTPGSHFDLFDKHEIFKEARIIDLDDKNFALTKDEKENILINHLKQSSVSICNCTYRNGLNSDTCDELCMEMPGNSVEICYKVVKDILDVDTYYGFPQACRIFSRNPSFTKMGVKYFQNPNKALVEEIESLYIDGVKEKSVHIHYHFCILVYLAFRDEINLSEVDVNFFKQLLDKFGDSNYKSNVLQISVEEISDKYLVGDFTRGPCRLQHATVREAIQITYGKYYPVEILFKCGFDFFSEYVRTRDFKGIYICTEDEQIIKYLLLKLPYVDINIIKQYIEKVPLKLSTVTSDQVLSFFENSRTLLDDDEYSGILNALMGLSVPSQFEKYTGQILKELLNFEDIDIISKFIRPNSCLKPEKNAVKVDDEILSKKLLNMLVGISYCSTFSPNDSYNGFANTCDELYLFDETSGTNDKSKQNAIGRYLYRVGLQFDGKSFVDKFLSMLEEHIRNINPIILEYMIDGFTGRGQLKEVVAKYHFFCEKNLFSYGSIEVVLNLCCPSSCEGSCDTYVKVGNSILAKKLLSHLTVQRQEIFVDSDDYDSDDPENYNNQYDDNESDEYDSDFCDTLVEAVGEYVYTFGIEKNDENFINAITSELSDLFHKRDSEDGLPWEYQTGRYLDCNLCKHFLYKGLDCEENREKIQQFPDLYAFIKHFKL